MLSCVQCTIVLLNVYKSMIHPGFKHIVLNTLKMPSCSVQLLSHVQPFVIPRTAAHQASLSFNNSQSLLKHIPIKSLKTSNHLILCCPFLLLPSIFLSIRVFSNELALYIRWPKDWSFSFSISPSNEYPGLISFSLIFLLSKGLSRVFSSPIVWKHQFFSTQTFLCSLTSIHDY